MIRLVFGGLRRGLQLRGPSAPVSQLLQGRASCPRLPPPERLRLARAPQELRDRGRLSLDLWGRLFVVSLGGC